MKQRPSSGLRPPKSLWRSSPLSPFDNDLRGPLDSQQATRRSLPGRREPSLSRTMHFRRAQPRTLLPKLRPPEDPPFNSRAYHVDDFDDEDLEIITRRDKDSSEFTSHEGYGSSTGLTPSMTRDREGHLSVAGQTATLMERGRGEERGGPDPSLGRNCDLATISDQLLGQPSPLPRDVQIPDMPRIKPTDVSDSLNFGQPASILPTRENTKEPTPSLETKSPTASLPQSTRFVGSKRRASEISDDEEPSISHHENADEPETHSSQHSTRAINTTNQDCPWLFNSLKRAESLFPSPDTQQELYKIYSMLRQLVRIAAAKFSIVDPQEFVETLSWSHLPPSQTQGIATIRRLRSDIATREGRKKKMLIPFRHNSDFYLAYIELSSRPRVLRVFDPDMMLQFGWHEKENFSSDWSPGLCVMLFSQTLFPEEPEEQEEWSRTRETTAHGAEPIDELGLVAGCYYGANGLRHSLPNVLPFFSQTLHLLAEIEPLEDVMYGSAIMKRLFAAFEGSPERGAVMEQLRRACRTEMRTLGDRIQQAKHDAISVAATGSKGSEGSLPQFMRMKRRAWVCTQKEVETNHTIAVDFVREHYRVSRIILVMHERLLKAKTDLKYEMCHAVYATPERLASEENEVWAEVEALHSEATLAVNEFGSRLYQMGMCLYEWKYDYGEAMGMIGSQERPKKHNVSRGTWRRYKIERGDLRERQRILAARRSTEPLSGRKRLQAARERLRREVRERLSNCS